MVKPQCAVLFVNPGPRSAYPPSLREMGFSVYETDIWPADGQDMRDYHVVVMRVGEIARAPMLAARLRAKPHFGQRVLIALVEPDTLLPDRRSAQASGFDDVITEGCDSRQLIARILRGLRSRPELRCLLPRPPSRRAVA